MKTRKYKTFNGLMSQNEGQMTMRNFLNGLFYHKKHGWATFVLEEKEKEKVLESFSKYCFKSKKAQNNLFDKLVSNLGDSSLFQCFYIYKDGFGNSLSGESFDYCLRHYK